jgi:hypothetical protein
MAMNFLLKCDVEVFVGGVLVALFMSIVFPSAVDGRDNSGDDRTSTRAVPDSLKRYPFRSAIIELEYGGSCSGKQMIYIDDFGMKEAKVDSFITEMMGMPAPTYKMQIQDWDSTFSADMLKGIATKGLTPFSAKERREMSEIGRGVAKDMGIEEGIDTVLGKPCSVWSMQSMSSKVWLWNDITLKSSVELDEWKQLLVAKWIEMDVPLPSNAFVIPVGMKTIMPEDINKMFEKLDEGKAKPAKKVKKKK